MNNTLRRSLPFLFLAASAAGIVGGVAPWIPHTAAGLRIGGFDLFEVSKYLPAVRSGALPVFREGFLLPIAISAVLLAWVPALPGSPRGAIRWLFPIAGAVIALSIIPPYPEVVTAYRDPAYRGQLFLSAGGFLLSIAGPAIDRLPSWLVVALGSGMAAVGAILPPLQLQRLRPYVAELYGAPVGVGWGIVLCTLGLGTLAVAGLTWLLAARLRMSARITEG